MIEPWRVFNFNGTKVAFFALVEGNLQSQTSAGSAVIVNKNNTLTSKQALRVAIAEMQQVHQDCQIMIVRIAFI
jgi:hypothetical protein